MRSLSLILFCCYSLSSLAQSEKSKTNIYTVSSWEMMLSFASIDNNGQDKGNVTRFSGVINGQNWVHFDVSKRFGFFIGNSMHNVGFIYSVPDSTIKKKYRTYNIGLPVGIKLGNLGNSYLFAGYELELPIHYKEKTFSDEKKVDKFGVWFSDRVPTFYHSIMIGLHSKDGISLKAKYYLNGFFNKGYDGTDSNGQPYQPCSGFEAHIFYFAVQVDLFRNMRFYHAPKKEEKMRQARLE